MSTTISLNKITTFFFGAGFVFLKIQQLPIPAFSLIVKIIAFVLYLIAYSLWLIRTLIDPDEKTAQDQWYNFAQLNEQFRLSALLGMLGCVLSIAGVFFPVFLLPAAWLFLIGNTIWTIGEYHKTNIPPNHDPLYSQSHQSAYLSYAIYITSMTLVTTLVTTLIFIFPAISVPLLICSSLICLGLGLLAWERWIEANYGEHPPNQVVNESYEQMNYLLGPSQSVSHEQTVTHAKRFEPDNSYEKLFQNPNENSSEIAFNSVHSRSLSRDI
jgi:hypothetical protein